MLLLGDFDYFAAFVVPAVRANAVRELRLMALRAFGRRRLLQVIVGPAGGGAPLGVAPFWIWHR